MASAKLAKFYAQGHTSCGLQTNSNNHLLQKVATSTAGMQFPMHAYWVVPLVWVPRLIWPDMAHPSQCECKCKGFHSILLGSSRTGQLRTTAACQPTSAYWTPHMASATPSEQLNKVVTGKCCITESGCSHGRASSLTTVPTTVAVHSSASGCRHLGRAPTDYL